MKNPYYHNIFANGGSIITTESELGVGESEPICEKEIKENLFYFALYFHADNIEYITTVGSNGAQQDYSEYWNNLREAVETCKRDDSFHPTNYDDADALFQDAEEIDNGVYSGDSERGETFFIRRRG